MIGRPAEFASMPRFDLNRRAMAAVLWMATIYAAFVATYRLDLPGLYYDEVLYLPTSFLALGNCSVSASVSAHLGSCFPLLLSPFYLGALKAFLYAPLVAIFPVSVELIRLPPMMLAIAIAVLSYRFFAPGSASHTRRWLLCCCLLRRSTCGTRGSTGVRSSWERHFVF